MSVMLDALKDFVRQPTGQNQAEDTVCLQVTHSNLKQRFIEIRVDLHVIFLYHDIHFYSRNTLALSSQVVFFLRKFLY